MARHDLDNATVGDIRKVVKLIRAMNKRLDDRIGDAFEAVQKGDETQADFWNEHEDKIKKLNRAVNRLVRDVEALSKDE